MATPAEKLAQSLEVLNELQSRGVVAIRTGDISRTHSERLLKAGFLERVIRGWFIARRPDEPAGESTAWFAGYWAFCGAYLNERFGDSWCLSPEQSLFLHTGNWRVPRQLLVRAAKPSNNVTALPHNTSLLDIGASLPVSADRKEVDGLQLFSLPAALVACSPQVYRQHPTELRSALGMLPDASGLLTILLDGGHSQIAGRLVGALRNIGRDDLADDVKKTMAAADYDVREADPFSEPSPVPLLSRDASPYVSRVRLMWQRHRQVVIEVFAAHKLAQVPKKDYLAQVEEQYVTDAYHSLSIEGYRVTPELIERVRLGQWNPDDNEVDREQRDAMAARGYWQAFQAVKGSIQSVLDGKDAGQIIGNDHSAWYRELFAPSVTSGLLKPSELAGYRNGPVYIRRSMHVPPSPEAVRDLMPVLFELLSAEPDPLVRAVLGHFVFVYIHPYTDGNGRVGRFLMNTMLASGGYPWTVIKVDNRQRYMEALEAASVEQDIRLFAEFIAGAVVSASVN